MGINQAEQRPQDKLVNEIKQLRSDFNAYRDNPQPIGNGSINYALFAEFNGGPFSIPPGLVAFFTVMFAPIGTPFTYDGREAVNKVTIQNLYWDVMVDVNDPDFAIPYGAALAGPERNIGTDARFSYLQSGLSDVNGQMLAIMSIENKSSSTHNYWIKGKMLIPRPALKKT